MNEYEKITQALEKGFSDILEEINRSERLWKIEDVCHYLGISRRLYSEIKDSLPAPRIISKVPRYSPDEIKEWADRQKVPQVRKGGRPRKVV